MSVPDRTRLLHGPYRPPRCRVGGELVCRLRGRVRVKALSAGRIQWPLTRAGRGGRAIVLCGDLARAVRAEAAVAVCHWWGVTPQTVSAWRKALGVGPLTEGTRRLKRDTFLATVPVEVRREATRKASSAEANARKGHPGVPRPPHVRQALAAGRQRSQTPQARRKRSEAHRERGTRPPAAGRPWTADEDALLGQLPDAEVARRTGRTVQVVYDRRRKRRVERG